jgi:hypothetical protein
MKLHKNLRVDQLSGALSDSESDKSSDDDDDEYEFGPAGTQFEVKNSMMTTMFMMVGLKMTI